MTSGRRWMELERDGEEPNDIEICNGGVATLDKDAHRAVSQEFRTSFIIWFTASSLLGCFIMPIPRFVLRQEMRQLTTPRQAGMWLGVLWGASLWSFICVRLARNIPVGTWRYLIQAIGMMWSYICLSFGFMVRKQYCYLVDPGPANQVFGMRNVSGSPFLVHFEKLKKTPPFTVPASGESDGAPPSAEAVSIFAKSVHDQFFVMCALLSITNLILELVLNPLGYSGHTLAWIIIIIVTDWVYSYIVNRSLKSINRHPLMIRRNISWTLRGFNLPFKVFSLWLVRTDPNLIIVDGLAGWYEYCPEEFKKTVKLFLWATGSLTKKALPRDVALLVLEYGSQHNNKDCVIRLSG